MSHVRMKTANHVTKPTNVKNAWMEMSQKTKILTTATHVLILIIADSATVMPNAHNAMILTELALKLTKLWKHVSNAKMKTACSVLLMILAKNVWKDSN